MTLNRGAEARSYIPLREGRATRLLRRRLSGACTPFPLPPVFGDDGGKLSSGLAPSNEDSMSGEVSVVCMFLEIPGLSYLPAPVSW